MEKTRQTTDHPRSDQSALDLVERMLTYDLFIARTAECPIDLGTFLGQLTFTHDVEKLCNNMRFLLWTDATAKGGENR